MDTKTEHSDIDLDDSAEQLYAQLGGVENRKLKKLEFCGEDRFELGLREELRRYDEMRNLVGNLVFQASRCLVSRSKSSNANFNKTIFGLLDKICSSLSTSSEVGRKALIRFKGGFGGGQDVDQTDYEILCGEISFDAAVLRAIAKRQGSDQSQLLERINRSFEVFSSHGINNFIIKIPQNNQELQRLLLSLRFAARYYAAIEKKSPISVRMGGNPVTLVPTQNERNEPDLNLTLLALFNGWKQEKMQTLVGKVDRLMRSTESTAKRYSYTSAYDAILSIKRFRSKLNSSPIEINNIKWLMVGNGQNALSGDMANLARLVMDTSGGFNAQSTRVLKSVYGEDYEEIDSRQVAERLHLTSGLLKTIETKPQGEELKTEVLNNVEERLSKVKDEVYDNIKIDGNQITAYSPGNRTVTEVLDAKLGKIVTFQKNRSVAKKKMVKMVHLAIDFEVEDYETLAKDFNVSVDDAKSLVKMLKSCFDSRGNFKKSTFVRIIPDLELYERRIFDFLWHNLKESLHHKDRAAFLDSLQLLVDRLKQPQNSISVLLDDLYQNPAVIRFADSKAFMLGNRLVREYSRQIVSYKITPEDVLMTTSEVDPKIARYAAWKIDKNQDKFFEKIQTVHRRLLEKLKSGQDQNALMGIRELLALERETYIFMAQVGGSTSKSVLLSALKEYGHPESAPYQLEMSRKYVAEILQILKIVIRGVGLVGGRDEIVNIESIKGRLEAFSELTTSLQDSDLINQLKESAEAASQKLKEQTG